MAYSEARSVSARDFSMAKISNYHSLPHVTQPILTKYRMLKPGNDLIIEEQSGFWCTIFTEKKSQVNQMSLCRCERTEDNLCELVIKWISEHYDWKNDPKFVKAYQSYTKRGI